MAVRHPINVFKEAQKLKGYLLIVLGFSRPASTRNWSHQLQLFCLQVVQDMAYRRSITSSDDDSTSPKFSKPYSDSSESAQSGTSAKYRRLHRRAPESPSPSPVESFEDDKENIHPTLVEYGEQAESEEEEDTSDYPVYLQPPQPIEISDDSHNSVYQDPAQPIQISDDQLQEVIQRFEAQSSYTGPPGFGAGSSAAAALQHHLNEANHRIEQLEGHIQEREYAHGEVEAENHELAERVAQLSVGFVMMGMGTDAADAVNGSLWMAVVVLVVMVDALLVRGWL